MPDPKFNEAESAKIRTEHEAGELVRSLARQYNTTHTTIRKTIKRAGGCIRNDRQRALQEAAAARSGISDGELIRLHTEERLNQVQISQRTDLPHATVSQRLKRLGRWTPYIDRAGRSHNSEGYIHVRVDRDWPFFLQMAKGVPSSHRVSQVLEHRKVMADHLGRALLPHESVHHLNGVRDDNRIENLQLRQGHHGNGQVHQCNCCGSLDISVKHL